MDGAMEVAIGDASYRRQAAERCAAALTRAELFAAAAIIESVESGNGWVTNEEVTARSGVSSSMVYRTLALLAVSGMVERQHGGRKGSLVKIANPWIAPALVRRVQSWSAISELVAQVRRRQGELARRIGEA